MYWKPSLLFRPWTRTKRVRLGGFLSLSIKDRITIAGFSYANVLNRMFCFGHRKTGSCVARLAIKELVTKLLSW